MTSRGPVQCLACVRYAGGVCEAYPSGIPADVLFFGDDHRSLRGDEAVPLMFQQGSTDQQQQAFEDWQATFG